MTNAEHFEAKKHALRQTQDGVVVSFTIHPSEIPKGLSLASLGTRFMVAVAEIGDDEKPKGGDAHTTARTTDKSGPELHKTPPQAENVSTPGARSRRKFSDLSLPQQAALRCQDPQFVRWLGCSMEDAPENLRKVLGISSRAELGTNPAAAERWRIFDGHYQRHLTDLKYPEAVR